MTNCLPGGRKKSDRPITDEEIAELRQNEGIDAENGSTASRQVLRALDALEEARVDVKRLTRERDDLQLLLDGRMRAGDIMEQLVADDVERDLDAARASGYERGVEKALTVILEFIKKESEFGWYQLGPSGCAHAILERVKALLHTTTETTHWTRQSVRVAWKGLAYKDQIAVLHDLIDELPYYASAEGGVK
jgi:hypothetical protein